MKLSSIMGRTKKKRQKQGIGPLGRLELKIRENIRAEMCAKWLKRYDRLPADLTGIPRKARTALRRRDAERQAEEERVSQLSEEERAAELRAKQQKEVAAGIEVPGVVVVAGYVIFERTGERIPACEGATLTFGRGLSSDVHIALPRCSRLHAKLTVTRGKQSHVRTEAFLRNRSATDATTRLRHCKTEAWWPLRSNWSAEPISHGDAFEICGERFRYQVARPRCLDDVVRPRVVVSTDLTAEPDAETDDDERPPVARRSVGSRRGGAYPTHWSSATWDSKETGYIGYYEEESSTGRGFPCRWCGWSSREDCTIAGCPADKPFPVCWPWCQEDCEPPGGW